MGRSYDKYNSRTLFMDDWSENVVYQAKLCHFNRKFKEREDEAVI